MPTRKPVKINGYKVYGDAVPDILHSAQKWNVDPWVALSLAYGEGGFNYGSVGDNGSSFGPYQLHMGGALPAGEDAKWANSPAGIDYAIRQISSAVGTRTGLNGITSGVERFERPAEPGPEISRDYNWFLKQTGRAKGRPPVSADGNYHPITSAQEALQGGLGDVVPGVGSLTDALSGIASSGEKWLVRILLIAGGVLLLLGVILIAVKT
jgi:hypothetical protein